MPRTTVQLHAAQDAHRMNARQILILMFTLLAGPCLAAEEAARVAKSTVILDSGAGDVRLNHMISLHGEGLAKWHAEEPQKPIDLYVDGIHIPGAQVLLTKLHDDWISFILPRDPAKPASREAWQRVLCRSLVFIGNHRKVDVTLGRSGELPLTSKVQLEMKVLYRRAFWSWLAGLAALLVALFYLGKKSELLRDDSPDPRTPANPNLRRPFSLARTQMAFWFFVTVAAYVFIFMVTRDTDTLTPGVLGLIGISAATGFAAVIVDGSKRTAASLKLIEKEQVVADLTARQTAAVAPAPPFPATDLFALNEARKEVAALKQELAPSASNGFFRDLVSDRSGVSFHRLQIVVWTLVVGVIFIHSVHGTLAMPELSATLLGLMGISGGTYLGFKLPEKAG